MVTIILDFTSQSCMNDQKTFIINITGMRVAAGHSFFQTHQLVSIPPVVSDVDGNNKRNYYWYLVER